MREVEVSIGQKFLDVNTKGVLVCYIFVSVQCSFFKFPGTVQIRSFVNFSRWKLRGRGYGLVTVSLGTFPVDDVHMELHWRKR